MMPHSLGFGSEPPQSDDDNTYQNSPIDSPTGIFPSSGPTMEGIRQTIVYLQREHDEIVKSHPPETSEKHANSFVYAETPPPSAQGSPLQLASPENPRREDRQLAYNDSFDPFWPSQRLLRGDAREEESEQQEIPLRRPSKGLKASGTRPQSVSEIRQSQAPPAGSRRNEHDQHERQTRIDRLIPLNIEGKRKQETPLKKRLEFKVCQTDREGEIASERWYLDLDEAAQEASESSQSPQRPSRTSPVTRHIPSDASLRPCFNVLFEEHQAVRKLVKDLREELAKWKSGKKRLPPQTPKFESPSDVSTDSEEKSSRDHSDGASAQYRERRQFLARKRRRSAMSKHEDKSKDRIIEDQKKKIKQMERHERDCELGYFSLQEGLKKWQNDLNIERKSNQTMRRTMAELTKENRELREEADPLRYDLARQKESIRDAKQDIIDLSRKLKDSQLDARPKTDELRIRLRKLQNDKRILQNQRDHLMKMVFSAVAAFKQASDRQSQQRAHFQFQTETKVTNEKDSKEADARGQMKRELRQLEQKYAAVEDQRNCLMEMAFRSVASLKEGSQRQSQWRAHSQLYLETKPINTGYPYEGIADHKQNRALVELRRGNVALQRQCDHLMTMAFESVAAFQQASEWQSRQLADLQFRVETRDVEEIDSPGPVAQASEQSSTRHIVGPSLSKGTVSTADTWERIITLRPGQVVDATVPGRLRAGSESTGGASELIEEPTGSSTTMPKTKPRKKRPAPIQTSIRPPPTLGQAYRLINSPGYHEGLEMELPTPAKAKPISALSEDVLAQSTPTSPGYFAWQDALTSTNGLFPLSGLTPLYDEAAKWPMQFNDRARVRFPIVGLNRNHKFQSFYEGQIVDLCIQPNDFWIIRMPNDADATPCLLPRNALGEVCPHEHEYYKYFEVVLPVPTHSNYLKTLPQDMVTAAHFENADPNPKKPENLGDQVACVKSHNLRTTGWLPVAILKHRKVLHWKDLDASATLCSCDPPEAYTGTAEVLKDCRCRDSGLVLKEGERVSVAHGRPGSSKQSLFSVRPSQDGLFCVKTVETGQRGRVNALYLRLLRQPIQPLVHFPGDGLSIALTPKFFQVEDQGFVEGEDGTIESFQKDKELYYEQPKGFSDAAKKSWETNAQGTNPGFKKWVAPDGEPMLLGRRVWKPWDDGIPDFGPYYIMPPDYRALPKPLKATLAVNPLGPQSGKRKARSRSLITATEPELRLMKHSPEVGHQPLSTISVSESRGYDSEPDIRQASSVIRKYIFCKSKGRTPEVVDAATEFKTNQIVDAFEDFGIRDPYGTDFIYKNVKMIWRHDEHKRMQEFPWGQRYTDLATKHPRPYHSYLAERAKAKEALEHIKDIALRRGYNVAYAPLNIEPKSESCVASFHTDDRVKIVEFNDDRPDRNGDDITVCRAWNGDPGFEPTAADDRQNFKSWHLNWQHPYLLKARYTESMPEEDSDLVLLTPSRDGRKWQCLRGDELRTVEAANIEVQPPDTWLPFHNFIAEGVLKRAYITMVIQDIALVHKNPPAVEPFHQWESEWNAWDWLFPVTETVTKAVGTMDIARDGRPIGAGDWVHMSDDGLHSQFLTCRLFMRQIQHRLPQHTVDWMDPYLLRVHPKQDIDCLQSDWLLALKVTMDGMICKLADGSISVVGFEDLLHDKDCISIVSLRELLEGGFICIPEARQSVTIVEEIEEDNARSPESASVKSEDSQESHVSSDTEGTEASVPFDAQQQPGTLGSAIIPSKDSTNSQFIARLDEFRRKFDPRHSKVIEHDRNENDSLEREFGLPTPARPLRIARKSDLSANVQQRVSSVPMLLQQTRAVPAMRSENSSATGQEAQHVNVPHPEEGQEQTFRSADVEQGHGPLDAQTSVSTSSQDIVQQKLSEAITQVEAEEPSRLPQVQSETQGTVEKIAPPSQRAAGERRVVSVQEFSEYKAVINRPTRSGRGSECSRDTGQLSEVHADGQSEHYRQNVLVTSSGKQRLTIKHRAVNGPNKNPSSLHNDHSDVVGISSSVEHHPLTSSTVRRRSTVGISASQTEKVNQYLARNFQTSGAIPLVSSDSNRESTQERPTGRDSTISTSRLPSGAPAEGTAFVPKAPCGESTWSWSALVPDSRESQGKGEERGYSVGEGSANLQTCDPTMLEFATAPTVNRAEYERIIDNVSQFDVFDRRRQEIRDTKHRRQQPTGAKHESTVMDGPLANVSYHVKSSLRRLSIVEIGPGETVERSAKKSRYLQMKLSRVPDMKLPYEVVRNHVPEDSSSSADTSLHSQKASPVNTSAETSESYSESAGSGLSLYKDSLKSVDGKFESPLNTAGMTWDQVNEQDRRGANKDEAHKLQMLQEFDEKRIRNFGQIGRDWASASLPKDLAALMAGNAESHDIFIPLPLPGNHPLRSPPVMTIFDSISPPASVENTKTQQAMVAQPPDYTDTPEQLAALPMTGGMNFWQPSIDHLILEEVSDAHQVSMLGVKTVGEIEPTPQTARSSDSNKVLVGSPMYGFDVLLPPGSSVERDVPTVQNFTLSDVHTVHTLPLKSEQSEAEATDQMEANAHGTGGQDATDGENMITTRRFAFVQHQASRLRAMEQQLHAERQTTANPKKTLIERKFQSSVRLFNLQIRKLKAYGLKTEVNQLRQQITFLMDEITTLREAETLCLGYSDVQANQDWTNAPEPGETPPLVMLLGHTMQAVIPEPFHAPNLTRINVLTLEATTPIPADPVQMQVMDFSPSETIIDSPYQAFERPIAESSNAIVLNGVRSSAAHLRVLFRNWQLMYWAVMLWMFLGILVAREEWLGVNGLGLNAVLQARYDRDGSWEWGGWEILGRCLDGCY